MGISINPAAPALVHYPRRNGGQSPLTAWVSILLRKSVERRCVRTPSPCDVKNVQLVGGGGRYHRLGCR
jgi:hypothetical protein